MAWSREGLVWLCNIRQCSVRRCKVWKIAAVQGMENCSDSLARKSDRFVIYRSKVQILLGAWAEGNNIEYIRCGCVR